MAKLIHRNSAYQFYAGSEYLPRALHDPIKGVSYHVDCTAGQDAMGTKKPMWEWLEETITVDDLLAGRNGSNGGPSPYEGVFGSQLEKAVQGRAGHDLIARPELEIFGSAMVGGGKATGLAHCYGKRVNRDFFPFLVYLTALPDFPWDSLGPATVVDVGAGVGT